MDELFKLLNAIFHWVIGRKQSATPTPKTKEEVLKEEPKDMQKLPKFRDSDLSVFIRRKK